MHTLENIREVPEVVINVVNHAMVHQQTLASTEYQKGVNEFMKAELARPPRVAESLAQSECRVQRIVALGDHPDADSLVLAEVLRIHMRGICWMASAASPF